MERSERVPQLYGYSVCLIAIVVGLISIGTIVNKAFVLADPLRSRSEFGWGGSGNLSSFEAYRATYERRNVPAKDGKTELEQLTDDQLRARYDALRADALARARFDAAQELTGSSLLLVVSVGLFVWHWRWVRGADMRALAARTAIRDSASHG